MNAPFNTLSSLLLWKYFSEQNAVWITLICPFDILDHSTASLFWRFAFCLGGAMRGASRKVPALARFPNGHNSHRKSLDSTALCASCIWEGFVPAHFEALLQWDWKSHGWVVSPKPRWSLGLLGVMEDFAMSSSAGCCPWFGREWTPRVTLRNLLSLFVCLVFPSERFMITKSIFL